MRVTTVVAIIVWRDRPFSVVTDPYRATRRSLPRVSPCVSVQSGQGHPTEPLYSQGKDIFLCNCPESLLKEGKGSPRSDNVELVCVQVSLYATGGGVKAFCD